MKTLNQASVQTHYDFIVVGAGAAGSVLAAELSASGAQVLVIESGGPDLGVLDVGASLASLPFGSLASINFIKI